MLMSATEARNATKLRIAPQSQVSRSLLNLLLMRQSTMASMKRQSMLMMLKQISILVAMSSAKKLRSI